MGHAAPFDFSPEYRPAPGVARFLCGTPPILSMASLEAAVDLWLEVDLEAAARKARALGDLFIALLDQCAPGYGLDLASPRDGARRGAHVSVRHPRAGEVMHSLISAGVVGDVRPPDLMRFGFAALTTRYADAWDAVARLAEVFEQRSA
jgi:kynureninase